MMEKSEEEKIIKDIRNLFRLKYNKMTLQLKIWEIVLDWTNKLQARRRKTFYKSVWVNNF